MRLASILAVAVVVTLHASATAFPAVKDTAAIENGAVADIVDSSVTKGGRMLRVDYESDDDDLDDKKKKTRNGEDPLDNYDEEERGGFADALKKLNPVTAAKKSAKKAAEHSAKVKKTLQEAADYQKMIEKARAMANMGHRPHCRLETILRLCVYNGQILTTAVVTFYSIFLFSLLA